MTDAVTVLRNGGLTMPEPIAQAAADVGLELAAAAALAEKESGGRMVWGHDPVDTDGTYTKGGPVTVENYWAYRKSPRAGWQGVGITQLTWRGYIQQAEQQNPTEGAANPLTNCRVGFKALLDLQRQNGEQDGARAYNGSGSAAEAYGRDFIAKRDTWRQRLAGATGTGWDPASMPGLSEGVTSDLAFRVAAWFNTLPGLPRINNGTQPPSRVGPQWIAAGTEFQRQHGITPVDPFRWGPQSWNAAKDAGFPG